MKFSHLIKVDQIQINNSAGSKKKALESISQLIHDNYPELSTFKVFDALLEREKLGSTGIDHSVALPHGRLAECTETIAVFMTLANPVDYDSLDKKPVKLLFALLIPPQSTEEHLHILAKLAEFFRQEDNRKNLSNATSVETIYNILINI